MSTTDYQGLVGTYWTVRWIDANGYAGVTQGQTLEFATSPSTIKVSGADWASYAVQSDRIEGVTSDQRAFYILLDSPTQLSCRFVSTYQWRRRLWSVVLGAFLGLLSGTVAGIVSGSPAAVSVLAALAAALTASLATARVTPLAEVNTGPGASWVAEEGKNEGRPAGTLRAVGANSGRAAIA